MDKGFYTELSSHDSQNGLVLEARDKSQVGSFDKFLRLLSEHKPDVDLNPKHVAVTYVTLNGEKMHFVFPDIRALNGKRVNLMDYEYYKGPFLDSSYGSQVVRITCRGLEMVLNFKKFTITGNGE